MRHTDLVTGIFRVARNPDADSTLPYVVEIPLSAGPLFLKVKDTWPRTAKIYCHELAASARQRRSSRRSPPAAAYGAAWPSTWSSTERERTARSSSSRRFVVGA